MAEPLLYTDPEDLPPLHDGPPSEIYHMYHWAYSFLRNPDLKNPYRSSWELPDLVLDYHHQSDFKTPRNRAQISAFMDIFNQTRTFHAEDGMIAVMENPLRYIVLGFICLPYREQPRILHASPLSYGLLATSPEMKANGYRLKGFCHPPCH